MSDPIVTGVKCEVSGYEQRTDVDAHAVLLEDRAAVEAQFSGSKARFTTSLDEFVRRSYATEMPSLIVGVSTANETYTLLGTKTDFAFGSKKGNDFGVSFTRAVGFSKSPSGFAVTKESKAGIELALKEEDGDAKTKLSAGYLNRDGRHGVYIGFGGRF